MEFLGFKTMQPNQLSLPLTTILIMPTILCNFLHLVPLVLSCITHGP